MEQVLPHLLHLGDPGAILKEPHEVAPDDNDVLEPVADEGDDELDLLGPEARFEDHIGEPRLIDGVVSADGRTSAIEVQVLRPRIGPHELDHTFGDDETARLTGPSMFTNEAQWLALEGIELAIAREKGLVRETESYGDLLAWAEEASDELAADFPRRLSKN